VSVGHPSIHGPHSVAWVGTTAAPRCRVVCDDQRRQVPIMSRAMRDALLWFEPETWELEKERMFNMQDMVARNTEAGQRIQVVAERLHPHQEAGARIRSLALSTDEAALLLDALCALRPRILWASECRARIDAMIDRIEKEVYRGDVK
jgi:hypothetical protein